ncbi:MAG: 2TM domain-containing protein [Gammaproteobacteria bacterium]|nr:2TM domain-containing protein [Gammaproteobacteria bacterium]
MNDQTRERARRQVRRLRGLYSHALVYAVVNLGLAALNLVTAPGDIWFIYPLLGWGIGLVSHAASVYAWPRLFGRDWEQRKIHEFMQREEDG